MEEWLPNELARRLGEVAKRARIRTGLNQAEFGACVYLDQSTMGKIERGERDLKVIELPEFCHWYRTSMVKFIGEYEEDLRRRGRR